MSLRSVCFQCPDRTMTCHGSCIKYKMEQDANMQRNAIIHKKRMQEAIATRTNKNCPGRKRAYQKKYKGKRIII